MARPSKKSDHASATWAKLHTINSVHYVDTAVSTEDWDKDRYTTECHCARQGADPAAGSQSAPILSPPPTEVGRAWRNKQTNCFKWRSLLLNGSKPPSWRPFTFSHTQPDHLRDAESEVIFNYSENKLLLCLCAKYGRHCRFCPPIPTSHNRSL